MASREKMLHWVEMSPVYVFKSINELHTAKEGTAGQTNKPNNEYKKLSIVRRGLIIIADGFQDWC